METNPKDQAATTENVVEATEAKNPNFKPSKEHALERINNKKDETIKEMQSQMEKMQNMVESLVSTQSETLLKSNGVEDDEAKELVEGFARRSGLTMNEVLADPIVKEKLRAIAGRKKAEQSSGQGADGTRSIESYIKSQTLPDDPELARQVRKAMLGGTSARKSF